MSSSPFSTSASFEYIFNVCRDLKILSYFYFDISIGYHPEKEKKVLYWNSWQPSIRCPCIFQDKLHEIRASSQSQRQAEEVSPSKSYSIFIVQVSVSFHSFLKVQRNKLFVLKKEVWKLMQKYIFQRFHFLSRFCWTITKTNLNNKTWKPVKVTLPRIHHGGEIICKMAKIWALEEGINSRGHEPMPHR